MQNLDEFPRSMFSHKNFSESNDKYYLKIEERLFFSDSEKTWCGL